MEKTGKIHKTFGSVKERFTKMIFYGHSDSKRGLPGLTVSICENFDPFFSQLEPERG